jgi:hypothetical protein
MLQSAVMDVQIRLATFRVPAVHMVGVNRPVLDFFTVTHLTVHVYFLRRFNYIITNSRLFFHGLLKLIILDL